MSKLQKVFSVAAAAVLALSMMILPAQAATGPSVGICQGTATVSPGLYFPGVGDSQTFTWELDTTCTAVSQDGVETFALQASGTATGWCGRSVGSGGSGTLSNSSQTITLSNIGWESVGSVLLVTGNHDGPGSATNTFAAEVEAQGGADCAGSGATSFEVVVVAEFA